MAADPKREFALDVVRRLRDAGHAALWAGGCVRDLLLGIPPKDYDVATDAMPQQVVELFGRRRTQAVGAIFGVVLVRGPKRAGPVEVATFRTDGSYLDGRRPESVEFSTPEEDAKRRDFTINGMFYDPVEKRVHDFVGGERDLSAGVVRAIGDPHDRMREDKLRMLRAVRFAATLDFELDAATADAIREMAPEMLVVSAERVAQELRRMLTDRHRMRAMKLARDTGLLQVLLPELRPIIGEADSVGRLSKPPVEAMPSGGTDGLESRPTQSEDISDEWKVTLHMLQLLQEPGFALAAAVLLQGVSPDPSAPEARASTGADDAAVAECAGRICRRFRMSNEETDEITWLLERRHAVDDVETQRPSQLKRLLIAAHFHDLLAFARAERLARNVDLRPVLFCEDYLASTPEEEINPPELITGEDLIRQGLSPGPRFRELLTAVRDAQLDGEISTREEAVALVQRLQGESTDDMQ
jgi:poly(A) polymerase